MTLPTFPARPRPKHLLSRFSPAYNTCTVKMPAKTFYQTGVWTGLSQQSENVRSSIRKESSVHKMDRPIRSLQRFADNVNALCSAKRSHVTLDCGSAQWSSRSEGNNMEGLSARDGELNNEDCA